jgi:RNAse (barnase) inhibitor barstar
MSDKRMYRRLSDIIDAEKREGIDLRYTVISKNLEIKEERVKEIDVFLLNMIHKVDVPISKRLWMIFNECKHTNEMCYSLYMFGLMMGENMYGRKI